MLVVLLQLASLALANSEWVEISQQHYRKPMRGLPHTGVKQPVPQYPSEETQIAPYLQKEDIRRNNQEKHDPVRQTYYPSEVETQVTQYPTKELIRDDPYQHKRGPGLMSDNSYENDEIIRRVHPKGNRIYINHSISEHSWNQNKLGVLDNDNNFKHINVGDFKVKPNITPEFSLEIYGTATELPELFIKNKPKEQERVSATIERVPNTGSVKRVQLSNTPIKAPIDSKPARPLRNDIRKHELDPDDDVFSDEFNIKSDIFKKTKEKVITTSPVNFMKHDFSTKETAINIHDRLIVPTSLTREPTIPIDEYLTANSQKQIDPTVSNNGNYKIKNVNISAYKENRITDTKVQIQSFQEHVNKVNSDEKAPLVTENVKYKESEKDINFEEAMISNDAKTKAKQNKQPSTVNSQFLNDRNTRPNSDSSSSGEENGTNEKLKVNTMENLLQFIKVVADTISKNTKRGVNGKVRYLNELKDTLLSSIKGRIDAAWPDDRAGARRSRSAARGHVEFPSSESALMTISFLTFAVFLIKLVLQVIQTYKSKTMMVAPLVVATAGRAVRKLRTHHSNNDF